MTEPEQQDELIQGSLFAEECVDLEAGGRKETAEVHTGAVFIPAAWRKALGLEQDDAGG